MMQPIGRIFVNMSKLTFTHLFSDIYAVKSGLAESGIHLTNNQVFSLLLIKEFMITEKRGTITEREIFDAIISKSLGYSRSTFHRAVNALTKEKCLLPMYARKDGGWIGIGEEYRLTTVSKRVDMLLGLPKAD